jgi:hypothetical protein
VDGWDLPSSMAPVASVPGEEEDAEDVVLPEEEEEEEEATAAPVRHPWGLPPWSPC